VSAPGDGNLNITVDASQSYMGTFHVFSGLSRENATLVKENDDGMFVVPGSKGAIIVFLSNNSDKQQQGFFTY
jgi:hypothetical protein